MITADQLGAWTEHAACADQPTDLFFPEQGRWMEAEKVRGMCASCPVLAECRDHGLRYEKWGVWGGLSGQERERERRRLGIRADFEWATR